MADNTVYINRVQEIPTSNSQKGIYLYSDPITNVKGIYVAANNEVTDLLESKLSKGRVLIDGEYVSINSLQDIFNNVSTGGGTGSYINTHPILQKIGGILKDTDFSTSVGINTILNKMFFPNLGKTFPTNPVFVGFMQVYPTQASIQQLFNPEDFYEFDFNEVIDEGFIVIALPATYYLSRVEDTNGLNIVNSFELIYKSIPLQNDIDIYNVYVSPELVYNDRLELTFTSVVGTPVQVVLESGEISVDDVIPVINSITLKEGIKSIINDITIGVKDTQPVINSISISNRNVTPEITSIKCSMVETNSILNDISIKEGIKSVLNSISITEDVNIVFRGITISEDTLPVIHSITIKDGRSILNSITIKEHN